MKFSLVCFIEIVQTIYSIYQYFIFSYFMFKYFIFKYSIYIIFTEAAMFFTVAQTGQTKPFCVSMTTEATTGSLSCLEEEGEVRGVQLQHDTSPLDVTTFYTLNL